MILQEIIDTIQGIGQNKILLALEDENERLSRNVGKELLLYAAFLPSKIRPLGCAERTVRNYYYMLHFYP
jgi:hypothetical protein